MLATLLYPPCFLLICKAACCKFVLKVSKIGGGALPGFTCGTVTPQLVQLCVFCSYVVSWYVWKIDFCIYFVFVLRSLSVYVRAEHQELLLVFFAVQCFFSVASSTSCLTAFWVLYTMKYYMFFCWSYSFAVFVVVVNVIFNIVISCGSPVCPHLRCCSSTLPPLLFPLVRGK